MIDERCENCGYRLDGDDVEMVLCGHDGWAYCRPECARADCGQCSAEWLVDR